MPWAGAVPLLLCIPGLQMLPRVFSIPKRAGGGGEERLRSSCSLAHSDFFSSLSGEAARCETWDVALLGCRMVSDFNVALSLCRPMCNSTMLSRNTDYGRGWLNWFGFLLLLFPLLFFFGNVFSSLPGSPGWSGAGQLYTAERG